MIPPSRQPDPLDVLTADDVPELPNGMATVIRVTDPQGRDTRRVTPDEHGFLREIKRGRKFVPVEWRVVGTGWSA